MCVLCMDLWRPAKNVKNPLPQSHASLLGRSSGFPRVCPSDNRHCNIRGAMSCKQISQWPRQAFITLLKLTTFAFKCCLAKHTKWIAKADSVTFGKMAWIFFACFEAPCCVSNLNGYRLAMQNWYVCGLHTCIFTYIYLPININEM